MQTVTVSKNPNLKNFEISVPGSKSYSNRALIIAALAKGKSTLKNLLICDDTLITLRAVKNLGIKTERSNKRIIVYGQNGKFSKPKNDFYLGNAGTAVRFLTATLTLTDFKSRITGNRRMNKRPIGDLVRSLQELGADITCNGEYPPIEIIGNKLRGGTTNIRGDISSQFISALLIASPYAQNDIEIKITGEPTSSSYIDTTIDIMNDFGITVKGKTKNGKYKGFFTKAPAHYAAREFEIPADMSSASYFLAIAAINGIEATIKKVPRSFQGDFQFPEILKKMGCRYKHNGNTLTLSGPKQLCPIGEIDVNNMPDSAMTLAVVCAFARGESRLSGLTNLRIKECDRLKAVTTELNKIGCRCEETKDGLIIRGNPRTLHGNVDIETYEDHRMAMCFAVTGTRLENIRIINPKCVSKTYPSFFEDMKKIGCNVTHHP